MWGELRLERHLNRNSALNHCPKGEEQVEDMEGNMLDFKKNADF